MKALHLAIRLGKDDEGLASDIFSGKVTELSLPFYLADEDIREFILVAEGTKPGVALVKVGRHRHGGLPSNVFTILNIKEVKVIPMDFAAVQNARYFEGALVEEGDTESETKDILGKLAGP